MPSVMIYWTGFVIVATMIQYFLVFCVENCRTKLSQTAKETWNHKQRNSFPEFPSLAAAGAWGTSTVIVMC